MRKITAFIILVVTLQLQVYSQTYVGGGGHINDDGSENYYPLNVTALSPAVMDSNYGLETVCINLTHTWDDDLVISVIAPDGSECLLSARHGGDGDNYTNTCFNQDATTHISLGSPPFTGTFVPDGSLANANNGQNGNGLWKLHIKDTYPFADEGDVIGWSVTFGPDPALHFPFTGSGLPLVIIDANGNPIPDDPKIMVSMRIIDNGPGNWNTPADSANVYYGVAGIELRGNSSQNMPKKSYNFETRLPDSSNRNVSLLGMPSESDWLLLANYADKSLLRNFFSYHLYNKTGRYAPRMHICDLILDGEYQGIYLLGEKIKRDGQRVDIKSLSVSDTLLPDLSGGYIFKIDWIKGDDVTWSSNYPAVGASGNLQYILEYPKPENVQNAQLKYIKSCVDTFEYVMTLPSFADPVNGYRKYVDEGSFIDYILLTEFTKNVDGYRLSTFLHKNRNGKICAGPPWDYDLAWGNANYMNCASTSGWAYEIQMDYTDQCPFWWEMFFKDSIFVNSLRCRWDELRSSVYNPQIIKHEIDSVVALMGNAVDQNFTKWQILGIYVWPNPAPIPPDYAGEVQALKNWVDNRIAWLDANIPGWCPNPGIAENDKEAGESLSVYPNPVTDKIYIRGSGNYSFDRIGIYNPEGQCLQTEAWDGISPIGLSRPFKSGVYFIKLYGGRTSKTLMLVIAH